MNNDNVLQEVYRNCKFIRLMSGLRVVRSAPLTRKSMQHGRQLKRLCSLNPR